MPSVKLSGWQAEQAGRGAETRWGDETARRLAGGEPAPAEWLVRGSVLLDQAAQQVYEGRQDLDRLRREYEQTEKLGDYGKAAELKYELIPTAEENQQVREALLEQYAGGAERLARLIAEAKLAQEAAEKKAAEELAAQVEESMQQAKKQAYSAFVFTAKHGDYNDLAGYSKLLGKQGYSFENENEVTTFIITPGGIRLPEPEFRPEGKTIAGLVLAVFEGREQQALEQERATAIRELALMDRAFKLYKWEVGLKDLTACLVVPRTEADQLMKQLRTNLGTLAGVAHLGVQGEPLRTDNLETIYVKYPSELARQASFCFDQIRGKGNSVYEPAEHQRRREQMQAQSLTTPRKTQERALTKSNGIEM